MSYTPLKSLLFSSIGRKVVIAIAGLTFFFFLIFHLLGNLIIILGSGHLFNAYSHALVSLGYLLYLVEIVLFVAFFFHFILAAIITLKNSQSRPYGYKMAKSAGGPSRETISSRTMIYTGVVVLVFVVLHVITFKYGPGIAQGYVTTLDGQKVRDLYRLVIEVFKNKWFVIWYVFAMIFLGFHVRHAFWSAFQSLGANNQRWTPILFWVGTFFAFFLGIGFLLIPLWVYFVL